MFDEQLTGFPFQKAKNRDSDRVMYPCPMDRSSTAGSAGLLSSQTRACSTHSCRGRRAGGKRDEPFCPNTKPCTGGWAPWILLNSVIADLWLKPPQRFSQSAWLGEEANDLFFFFRTWYSLDVGDTVQAWSPTIQTLPLPYYHCDLSKWLNLSFLFWLNLAEVIFSSGKQR